MSTKIMSFQSFSSSKVFYRLMVAAEAMRSEGVLKASHETRCALLGERNKRNSRNTGPFSFPRLRNRNLMKTK
jgi:hypothetical protein